MRYNTENFSVPEGKLSRQWLSEEAGKWTGEFIVTPAYKSITDILEELALDLPPGEKFKPGLKKKLSPDSLRLYISYNNLNVAPEIKRNDKFTPLLGEKERETARKKIQKIADANHLPCRFSYYIPTEKFEVNIFNPFLPIEY